MKRNRNRKPNAAVMSARRTNRPSAAGCAADAFRARGSRTMVVMESRYPWSIGLAGGTPPHPGLQQVDGQQQQEGNPQHHHGDGRGALVVVLLQFGDYQ